MNRTALQPVDSLQSRNGSSAVAIADEPREPEKKTRKIAILGKAPSSQQLAPFGDPSWEIWILNTIGHLKEASRWDRQFELHRLELTKEPGYGNYYQWLCQQEKPVYVREPSPEIKSHIVYPRDEVMRFFGRNLSNIQGPIGSFEYFTNTVSWMMALALYEGCDEIGLYGVDMAQHAVGIKSEYAHQRPSCEFFVGYALGSGVKVTIPETSDLCKTAYLYGFESHRPMPAKLAQREKELKAMHAQATQQAEEASHRAAFLSGALEDMQYHKQSYYSERDGK